MKYLKLVLYLYTLVTLAACQSNHTSSKETSLNLDALSAAERIIPSDAGYLLLELKSTLGEEDPPRQLALYNNNGKFLDKISLFGTVQSTGRKRIEINRSMNDFIHDNRIGFLRVDYVELPRRSKGGGNYGTFLVDSIKYVPQTGMIDIYLKKPATQFVIVPSEFRLRENEFLKADKVSVLLKNIRFELGSTENKYFTITTQINKKLEGDSESNYYNRTTAYYFKSTYILHDLYSQILKNFK